MIEIVEETTDEVVEAMQRLVPQLSPSSSPRREDVAAIVSSEASSLLIARDMAGKIAGTLTLVIFHIPTGVRAWVEDMIVDEHARGTGIGAALTQEAVRLAREAGARTLDLTSRPSREAANALYHREGFTKCETHVYRYIL